jgi:hypothetical protein
MGIVRFGTRPGIGFGLARGRPATPSAALWTPAALGASLALWLDADDASTITLNGGKVSQWNDKSGNARHATQATAANQLEYIASTAVLGGKPSVGATATTGYELVGTITPSFAAREWLFVTAYLNGVTALFPDDFVFPTLLSGPNAFGAQRAGMGAPASADWFTSSVWAAPPYRNGAETTSTTALPMPATLLRFEGGTTATQTWGIGFNQATSGRTWRGPIGEVIAVGATLSTADRQKLEGYLAHKWALTANLPAEHPYKSTPPTV